MGVEGGWTCIDVERTVFVEFVVVDRISYTRFVVIILVNGEGRSE